jgi:hypothetical protein
MFQVTYKAGWSQVYVALGTYETREEARQAIRTHLRGSRPKVWSIRVKPVKEA